jgi:hypothetical protein
LINWRHRVAGTTTKLRAAVGILSLLLLSGCYVRTNLRVQTDRVPQGFSSPALVIAVSDSVGLSEDQLSKLREDALQAFTDRGLPCTSLEEAVGTSSMENPGELLKGRGYRALLEIRITSWGSKTETLADVTTPSVESVQTSRDSSFFPPGSFEESQHPGPTTSYKEVEMSASLLDVREGRVLWSARVTSRPVLAGRSFLYHQFNKSLRYEDLAQRCLLELSEDFPRIRPAATDTSPPSSAQ